MNLDHPPEEDSLEAGPHLHRMYSRRSGRPAAGSTAIAELDDLGLVRSHGLQVGGRRGHPEGRPVPAGRGDRADQDDIKTSWVGAAVGTSSSAIFFTHAVATLLLAIAAPQPDGGTAGDAGRRLDGMRDAADRRGRSGQHRR